MGKTKGKGKKKSSKKKSGVCKPKKGHTISVKSFLKKMKGRKICHVTTNTFKLVAK